MSVSNSNGNYSNRDSDTCFLTQNRFVIPDNEENGDDTFHTVESVRDRKRTRVNTGGSTNVDQTINIREYERLTVDDKLSVMFSEMKTIGQKVNSCVEIHTKVQNIESSLSEQDRRIKLLEYKSIDLEARSRRNNLIFGGIPEDKDENCGQKLAAFLQDHLGIDPCPPAPRVHRLGKFKAGSNRAIIAYFLDFRDTEYILSNAKKLKGTDFHVNRDYPKEIVDARRILWPQYKLLRDANRNSSVSIVFPAKLVMDGRVIADMFPHWNLIMQGNRITFNKPVFTNTKSRQTTESCESHDSHSSTDYRDPRANRSSNPSQQSVNTGFNQARSRSRTLSVGEKGAQRTQSSSPNTSRKTRSRAPSRPLNSAHPQPPPPSNQHGPLTSSQHTPVRPWMKDPQNNSTERLNMSH